LFCLTSKSAKSVTEQNSVKRKMGRSYIRSQEFFRFKRANTQATCQLRVIAINTIGLPEVRLELHTN